MERTGDSFYQFLVWNLFLAWVPLICAAAAFARARRGIDAVVIALLLLWLLFFPNAPYMLTDFIHVGESPSVPLWYDALMLSSFAWTALLLGFASLYLVQIVVRRCGWSCLVVGRRRCCARTFELRGLSRALRALQQLGCAPAPGAGRAGDQQPARKPTSPPSNGCRARGPHCLPARGVRRSVCVRRDGDRAPASRSAHAPLTAARHLLGTMRHGHRRFRSHRILRSLKRPAECRRSGGTDSRRACRRPERRRARAGARWHLRRARRR